MVPTLTATLCVKGERPVIGTRDCKDVVHTFASANVTTGEVTSRLYGSRTQKRRRDGLSKTKRMQVAFAHHLLDVARAYPATTSTPKSSSSSTTRLGTADGRWTGLWGATHT